MTMVTVHTDLRRKAKRQAENRCTTMKPPLARHQAHACSRRSAYFWQCRIERDNSIVAIDQACPGTSQSMIWRPSFLNSIGHEGDIPCEADDMPISFPDLATMSDPSRATVWISPVLSRYVRSRGTQSGSSPNRSTPSRLPALNVSTQEGQLIKHGNI